MKIKLSSIYASPNITAQPGDIINVSDAEGRGLIAGGYGAEVKAAPVAAVPAPAVVSPVPAAPAAEETAATVPPENTARRTGRGRSRVAAPSE